MRWGTEVLLELIQDLLRRLDADPAHQVVVQLMHLTGADRGNRVPEGTGGHRLLLGILGQLVASLEPWIYERCHVLGWAG